MGSFESVPAGQSKKKLLGNSDNEEDNENNNDTQQKSFYEYRVAPITITGNNPLTEAHIKTLKSLRKMHNILSFSCDADTLNKILLSFPLIKKDNEESFYTIFYSVPDNINNFNENEIKSTCSKIRYSYQQLIPQKLYVISEIGMISETDIKSNIIKLMRSIHHDYEQYNKHLLNIAFKKTDSFYQMYLDNDSVIKVKNFTDAELKTNAGIVINENLKINIASYTCMPYIVNTNFNYSSTDSNERLIQFYSATSFDSLLSFMQWQYNNNSDTITLIGAIIDTSITRDQLEYLNSALSACTQSLGTMVKYNKVYVFSNHSFQPDSNRNILKFTNVYVQFTKPSNPQLTIGGNKDVVIGDTVTIMNPLKCNYFGYGINPAVKSVLYYLSDITISSLPPKLKALDTVLKHISCAIITAHCDNRYTFIPFIITLYHHFLKNPNNKLILILKITDDFNELIKHLHSKIPRRSIWYRAIHSDDTSKTIIITSNNFGDTKINNIEVITDLLTSQPLLIVNETIPANVENLKSVNVLLKKTFEMKVVNLLTTECTETLKNNKMNVYTLIRSNLQDKLIPMFTENKIIIVYDKNDIRVLKQIFNIFIINQNIKEISFVHISNQTTIADEITTIPQQLLKNNIIFKNTSGQILATIYNNNLENVKLLLPPQETTVASGSNGISISSSNITTSTIVVPPNSVELFDCCIINNDLTKLVEPQSEILPPPTLLKYPGILKNNALLLSILKKITAKASNEDDKENNNNDDTDDRFDSEQIIYNGYQIYDSSYEMIFSNASHNQIKLIPLSKDLMIIKIPKVITPYTPSTLEKYSSYQSKINDIGVVPRIVLHFIYNPDEKLIEDMMQFIKDSTLTLNKYHIIVFTSTNKIQITSAMTNYKTRDNIVLTTLPINSFINVNIITTAKVNSEILQVTKKSSRGVIFKIDNLKEKNLLWGSVSGIWNNDSYKNYNAAFCLHSYVKEVLWLEPSPTQSILDFKISTNLTTMSLGYFTLNNIKYLPSPEPLIQNKTSLNDIIFSKIMFMSVKIIALPRLCHCIKHTLDTYKSENFILNLSIDESMFKLENIDIKKYIFDCFNKFKLSYEYDSINNIYWLFPGFKLNLLNTDKVEFKTDNEKHLVTLHAADNIINHYSRHAVNNINTFPFICLSPNKSSLDVVTVYPPFSIQYDHPLAMFEYNMNEASKEILRTQQILKIPLDLNVIYNKIYYNSYMSDTNIEKYMGLNLFHFQGLNDNEILTLLYFKMAYSFYNSVFIISKLYISSSFHAHLTALTSKLPNWIFYDYNNNMCILLAGAQFLKVNYENNMFNITYHNLICNIEIKKPKSNKRETIENTTILLLDSSDTSAGRINYKSGNVYKILPGTTNTVRGVWSYNETTFETYANNKAIIEELFSTIQYPDLLHITESIPGISTKNNTTTTEMYTIFHVNFHSGINYLPFNTLIDNCIDFTASRSNTQILFFVYKKHESRLIGDKVIDEKYYTAISNSSENDFFNHVYISDSKTLNNVQYYSYKINFENDINIFAIKPFTAWKSGEIKVTDENLIKINNFTITTDLQYTTKTPNEIAVIIETLSTLHTKIPNTFKQNSKNLDSGYFSNGTILTISN